MKNILVTGGAGYIGAHIVDLLCENSYNVIVFDNLESGFYENLNNNSQFVKGDIKQIDHLNDLFNKFEIDAIIHMAAYKSVSKSFDNIFSYTQNNINGSLNLISTALKYKIKKFVFSSTAAVYGNPVYHPIDEKHPVNPINYYGYTKLFIEKYLKYISSLDLIDFISFRYFNAAGYSEKENLIKHKEVNPENLLPIIMEVALSEREQLKIFGKNYSTKDGTCIRDYIHVLDLAHAHLNGLEFLRDNTQSKILNLSTGLGTSVLEVVKATEKITGKKINFSFVEKRTGDPKELISKSNESKKYLNWEAKYTLDDIIKSMWKIYCK